MSLSEDRIKVLNKIEQYEKEGKFDLDVEDDLESKVLMPDDIDYLRTKFSSKIKTKIAYFIARRFLNNALKTKNLIVKEIKGIENFNSLESGAILTCNHFNAMDSFAMQMVYENSKFFKKKKMYKIIKEGNYTTFPGKIGFFMRHCYTLPLSSNLTTMKKFVKSIKVILNRGDFVLIYPEQSMWWNYKKPKPLKKTAFSYAIKNNVPILPCFITFNDSDVLSTDGSFIQEYTIHVSKPIYKDENLTDNENIDKMMKINYDNWKNIYEEVYQKELKYTNS